MSIKQHIYIIDLDWYDSDLDQSTNLIDNRIIPCANGKATLDLFERITNQKDVWEQYEKPKNCYIFKVELANGINQFPQGWSEDLRYTAARTELHKKIWFE